MNFSRELQSSVHFSSSIPVSMNAADYCELTAESFSATTSNTVSSSSQCRPDPLGNNESEEQGKEEDVLPSYQQEDADDDFIKNCPEHTVLSDILSRCCYFVTVQEPSVQVSDCSYSLVFLNYRSSCILRESY